MPRVLIGAMFMLTLIILTGILYKQYDNHRIEEASSKQASLQQAQNPAFRFPITSTAFQESLKQRWGFSFSKPESVSNSIRILGNATTSQSVKLLCSLYKAQDDEISWLELSVDLPDRDRSSLDDAESYLASTAALLGSDSDTARFREWISARLHQDPFLAGSESLTIGEIKYTLETAPARINLVVTPAPPPPSVFLNGNQLSFDVPPLIEDGRTLVPLRAIFEAMGAAVNWDDKTSTATGIKGDTRVVLQIGSTSPTINGVVHKLDVPGRIVSGRTLAPLRFVGEAFGGHVEWDGTTNRITITTAASGLTNSSVQVHFIDVGQGDAVYIQLPDHNDILIDAGDEAAGPIVVQYLKNRGVDDLELLVATHPHADHIGGIPAVLAAFSVERVVDSGCTVSSGAYEAYRQACQKAAKWEQDDHQYIQYGNVALQILTGSKDWNDVNDYSVVCFLDTGLVDFLLTGDVGPLAQEDIRGNVQATILKSAHHGSADSNTAAFLNRVHPKAAIISLQSGNPYGYPHRETLQELSNLGTQVYRTDQKGTIVVTTDGKEFTASAAR